MRDRLAWKCDSRPENAMKKTHPATSKRPAHAAVLTSRDLARVIGGTDGTIVVEDILVHRRGIEGTG